MTFSEMKLLQDRLRTTFKIGCLATALATATMAAQAQSYPDRPVRIVSGLLPGTSGDIAGRMLAENLTVQMHQSVIFENRRGANGQIAAKALKQSAPDGYNLFFTASSTMVTARRSSAHRQDLMSSPISRRSRWQSARRSISWSIQRSVHRTRKILSSTPGRTRESSTMAAWAAAQYSISKAKR
jgi:hypothetical protein